VFDRIPQVLESNVALTRAQSVLKIIGNWDKCIEEFEALYNLTMNFGLFLLDVEDKGDIIDSMRAFVCRTTLPKDTEVIASKKWTLVNGESVAQELNLKLGRF
jgi:hypothetical protein